MNRQGGNIQYVRVLLLVLVLAGALKTFVLDAVYIPSGSMEDSLLPGDFLLLDKLGYGPRGADGTLPAAAGSVLPSFLTENIPPRGRVVAFLFPADGEGRPMKTVVKRCVAVPGDTVALRNSVIMVNGKPVLPGRVEPGDFLREGMAVRVPGKGDTLSIDPVVVAEHDYVFVLGDNQTVSADGRHWGFLRADRVIGEPVLVYWSRPEDGGIRWDRIGTVVR